MFSSRWCYSIVLVFSYCPYSSLRAEGKSRCGRPSLGHVGVAAWVTSVVGGGAVSHRLGLGAPPPWQRDVAIEGSQSVSPLRCYLDPCGQWQCCAVAWRLSPVSAAAPGLWWVVGDCCTWGGSGLGREAVLLGCGMGAVPPLLHRNCVAGTAGSALSLENCSDCVVLLSYIPNR